MATEAWLEAARSYNRLDERARVEYWNRLTPEQREALREALASPQLNGVVASPVAAPASSPAAPARSGCGGPLAAGCVGVILGCLLTLGAEVAARIQERCFYSLEAPVLRVGGMDAPYPASRIEEEFLPDLDRVLDTVDRSLEY